MLIVADREAIFLLSGTGDLIQPDDGIVAIGSGGPYALAAARALARNTDALRARGRRARRWRIAADICIYTNEQIVDRGAVAPWRFTCPSARRRPSRR